MSQSPSKSSRRTAVVVAGVAAAAVALGIASLSSAQPAPVTPRDATAGIVATPERGAMAALPYVATATFGTQGDLRRRPKRIAVGDSQCSPFISRIRWQKWGPKNAVGVGRAVIPQASATMSCGEALQRAKARTTRVRLSRPRSCEGRSVAYMRIKLVQGGKNRYQHTRSCDW